LEKGVKMFSSSKIAIFHTTGLLSPQNKIRAGKLLNDQGHLQEERLGGPPTIATGELAATILW
jgi:hypothetical protein